MAKGGCEVGEGTGCEDGGEGGGGLGKWESYQISMLHPPFEWGKH